LKSFSEKILEIPADLGGVGNLWNFHICESKAPLNLNDALDVIHYEPALFCEITVRGDSLCPAFIQRQGSRGREARVLAQDQRQEDFGIVFIGTDIATTSLRTGHPALVGGGANSIVACINCG
jgi:hypothetical protein